MFIRYHSFHFIQLCRCPKQLALSLLVSPSWGGVTGVGDPLGPGIMQHLDLLGPINIPHSCKSCIVGPDRLRTESEVHLVQLIVVPLRTEQTGGLNKCNDPQANKNKNKRIYIYIFMIYIYMI